jgi:hypothetical protein
LTGSNPLDPILIEANTLSHPDDMKAAIACVKLCREIGKSAPLRPFAKRRSLNHSTSKVRALTGSTLNRRHLIKMGRLPAIAHVSSIPTPAVTRHSLPLYYASGSI